MTEKYLLRLARVMSKLFAPFYFCMLAFLVLFFFSYMRLLPWGYKLLILAIVYVFTIALPLLSIGVYKKLSGIHHHQMSKRERRYVPYIITIVSYTCCLILMKNLHVPHFMTSTLIGALFIEIICALFNSRFRISTHAAAAGGMNGALLAFSFIFGFNPIWWLCLTVFIAGLVGSSRLILRQHTLKEVNWGTVVGFLGGFLSVLIF